MPFTSARKWSGLVFDDPTQPGAIVLGAMEMMAACLLPEDIAQLTPKIDALSEGGLRVLLFASNPKVTTLHDMNEQPQLSKLTPLALVSLKDNLRRLFNDLGTVK